MTEVEQFQIHATARHVGEMISFCFIHALRDENFEIAAVEGLVGLADRLHSQCNTIALEVVIGALARLHYTYRAPGSEAK